jgi:cytoskeletal protein CcmA (bactofilin family)
MAGFFFSANTEVKGNLNETEDVIVDGRFDGNIVTTGFCEITENGVLKGNLTARNATILGTSDGEIATHENLVVKKSSNIHGYVITPKISIESGAVVNARIKQPAHQSTGLAAHE